MRWLLVGALLACSGLARGALISEKVFAGYQGWFQTSCDEAHDWVHWTSASKPAPGHVTVEIFPDVREYPESALCQAGSLSKLGNGSPAKLFTSRNPDVVDLHVSWAKSYGINGLGLQRFVNRVRSGSTLQERDEILKYLNASSVKHGTEFYIEYDMSGAADFVQVIKNDWVNHNVQAYTHSPAYASDGKNRKFVMIWGCAFPSKPQKVSDWTELLDFFHSKNIAVGVGVPYHWRVGGSHVTKGFGASLFSKFDLIEPWAVGAFKSDSEIDSNYKSMIPDDIAFCKSHGIQYRPVFFPGFSWSNWNGGSRNMIPRRGGQFMWHQAISAKQAGVSGAFVAMFDEFDEGTAILKAAESKSMIPTNQYFLTMDADGQSLSSDFYLRLTQSIGKMLRGEIKVTSSVPIPKRMLAEQ